MNGTNPLANMPFHPETIEKHLALGFMTRGNDIYHGLLAFILQQSNIFRRFSMLTSISLWGPGSEMMFKTLAEGPSDYVMILDSDVGPPPETAVRLIERNVDIVSAPVWMYDSATNDIHLNCHYDDKMERVYGPGQQGLQEIANTSWACVMMKHRVLEMFLQTNEAFTKWSPMINERWKDVPPDSLFYEKCKAFGFKIHMDWDCEFCTHHKHVSLNAPTTENFIARRVFAMKEGEHEQRAVSILSRRTAPQPA